MGGRRASGGADVGSAGEARLASRIGRLKCDTLTADCIVVVEGVAFRCRKCILASASPVFRTMLYEAGMREQRKCLVTLDGVSAAGWTALHGYCYEESLCDPWCGRAHKGVKRERFLLSFCVTACAAA